MSFKDKILSSFIALENEVDTETYAHSLRNEALGNFEKLGVPEREGAYIHIGKNIAVEKPIEIVYFSTGNERALMTQPRNLVVVGENSQVQIIERHQSLSDNEVLTNAVTEIFAAQRAMVDYYKIQNDKQADF